MRDLIGYGDIGVEGVMEDSLDESQPAVLTRLFEDALKSTEVRTGMIQHLLRRARSIGSPVLHQIVLDNLESLVAVFRDVCRYFISTLPTDPADARTVGDRFMDFARNSDYSCEFVCMWVLHMIQEKPGMAEYREADALAEQFQHELGIRPRALLAKAFQKVAWVRQQKETLKTLSAWDRRAVIYAADVLPDDERRHWLRMIKEGGDTLEAAIASYLLSRSGRAI